MPGDPYLPRVIVVELKVRLAQIGLHFKFRPRFWDLKKVFRNQTYWKINIIQEIIEMKNGILEMDNFKRYDHRNKIIKLK